LSVYFSRISFKFCSAPRAFKLILRFQSLSFLQISPE
jgi:hypothetical protein